MAERKPKQKQYTEAPEPEVDSWEPADNHWYQTAGQLAGQLENRPAFSYDPAADPLYQGARQEYLSQAKRARQDAQGRAAALTGGYGSTYAAGQGQQAYDAQLSRLAALLPTYYDRAKAAYDSRGKELRDALGVAAGLYDKEYQAYLDRVAEARRERDYQTDRDHWEREFAQSQQQWSDKQQNAQASQAASEASRNRSYAYKMAMLALQQGLKVSDSLLATAGIDKSYAELIRKYYASIHAGG